MKLDNSSVKIPALQGLRVLAYIGIFMCHASTRSCFVAMGVWGVSVFFVLSGFVMTYSYLNRGGVLGYPSISFSYKKINKLYSLHIATMLACVIIEIYWIINGKGNVVTLVRNILLHTTLIQIWIPNPEFYVTLNGVSWYLAVSAFLYFLFPLLLRIIRKFSKKDCLLSVGSLFLMQVAVSYIAFFLGNKDKSAVFSMQWITYYFPLSRLIDFSIGCCLGWLFLHRQENNEISVLYYSILEIVVFVGIFASWLLYAKNVKFFGDEYFKYTLLFTVTTVPLIWLCAQGYGVMSFVLSQKPFVSLAKLTPYTFLIHYVVLKYCRFLLRHTITSNKYVIASTAFILSAVASYIWIRISEALAIKRKNKQTKI